MIDHEHASKLAAKCRELSRQFDSHGNWPFMIEVAETIESLVAGRQMVEDETAYDDIEAIIKIAK